MEEPDDLSFVSDDMHSAHSSSQMSVAFDEDRESNGTNYEDGLSDHSGQSNENEELEDASATTEDAEPTFDPAVAATHSYLGDFGTLPRITSQFDPGREVHVPLLMLNDVVLMPGGKLPMCINTREELGIIEHALRQPEPFNRIIAVVLTSREHILQCDLRHDYSMVACTAEIRNIRREGDGSIHLLAYGRQRMHISSEVMIDTLLSARSQSAYVTGRVMSEGLEGRLPREFKDGMAWIPPCIASQYDAPVLSERALRACSSVLPPISHFIGGPREVSYWLATNLPLRDITRQELLSCATTHERLKMIIRLLTHLCNLHCSRCMLQITTVKDALLMNEDGLGSAFVNPHGYVHDLATFRHITQGALANVGEPETEFSWFPGYAWTICNCVRCGQHMGWKFTATRASLTPSVFWGIKRSAITCKEIEDSMTAEDNED